MRSSKLIEWYQRLTVKSQTEIVEVSDFLVRTEDNKIEIKEDFFYTPECTNIDEDIGNEIK